MASRYTAQKEQEISIGANLQTVLDCALLEFTTNKVTDSTCHYEVTAAQAAEMLNVLKGLGNNSNVSPDQVILDAFANFTTQQKSDVLGYLATSLNQAGGQSFATGLIDPDGANSLTTGPNGLLYENDA